ncbi:MAG: D-aminoacylase [Gemmatimonadetes bacterium]|nr:D-aminoacylase [Gemmatimonadota bacterium]
MFLLSALAVAQSPCPADLVIRNGNVLDGTGAPAVRADVAIKAGRITAVSATPFAARCGAREVDAKGLTVTPGFIDLHAHIEPILSIPDATNEVRQGVTLALGGPDGGGPSPFGTYVDSVRKKGLGLNVAWLAGHNTIRERVMGTANRAPTADELARMVTLVRESMRDGAFGLSTGLRYVPGYYSTVDEVIALARAASDSGGIYTSHLREEGLGLLDAVAEALEIGRRAHIPVVLTHHKAIGREMWGKSAVTLHMADSARKAGTDVMQDQYPYTASSTALAVLIPNWAQAGGLEALRKRVADPVLKDSILKGTIYLLDHDRGGGDLKRVQFASVAWQRSLEGKTLYDWAKQRGVPTTSAGAAPLVLEGELRGGASMVYHIMDEGDVQRIMRDPYTAIASDGGLYHLGDGVPHPRSYGTFPRVLGRYVRELHVLTLPEAVRKMTSLPARRLGLTDRGCVRAGCVADVTIIDPATVGERGTFTDPHHYPVGIPWVIVNGVPVVANGAMTTARPGQVVLKARTRRRADALTR